MAFWNRKTMLTTAIEDWQARGLVDQSTAGRLIDDVAKAAPARSFTTVIILLGVICLGFGAMTFVAANWQEMTSAARLALLVAALWASWAAAIWLKARGREWTAQAFILLACAVFGASIMLIGQIYHLQGEPKDAVWLWMVVTIIAALLTRSGMALALAAILITIWALMNTGLRRDGIEYAFIAYWLAGAAAAFWLKSRFAGHVLLAGMVVWLTVSAIAYTDMDRQGRDLLFMQIALSGALASVALLLYAGGRWPVRAAFFRPAIVYALLAAGAMLALWYAASEPVFAGATAHLIGTYWPGLAAVLLIAGCASLAYREQASFAYDIAIAGVMTAIATALTAFAAGTPFITEAFLLAMSIWTIRMGWRLEYRPLAATGWIGFAASMLAIYARTVGTLLDTSLFYLGAGVLLLAGAAIAARISRKTQPDGEAAK